MNCRFASFMSFARWLGNVSANQTDPIFVPLTLGGELSDRNKAISGDPHCNRVLDKINGDNHTVIAVLCQQNAFESVKASAGDSNSLAYRDERMGAAVDAAVDNGAYWPVFADPATTCSSSPYCQQTRPDAARLQHRNPYRMGGRCSNE